jgi:16S rRNA (cytidine1402-2'-O)-methyltransferase
VGTLYLVATPIGNLEDISARALRTLQTVRLIAAEDTRHTGRLLAHFGVHTPLTSYHEHNKLHKLETVLAELAQGDVALVSDAGTPALNDPGYELVRAVLQAGYTVSAIPGPSAPLAALVTSGLPTDAFLYLGYLPRKTTERQSLLARVATLPYTLIFLESPQRLLASLADLQAVLGERPVAVARELTKLHEEVFRGTLEQARSHFTAQPPRGEFTLVVGGYLEQPEPWPEDRMVAALHEALAQNLAPGQAASQLSALSGWPRRQVYQRLTQLQKAGHKKY